MSKQVRHDSVGVRSKRAEGLRLKAILSFIVCFLFGLIITETMASAELTVKINHDHIKVDFFYHGDKIGISGVSDSIGDLIVKITSPEGHQALRKKGKVAGLLWMNVGELKFERTPTLYFLHSTRKLEDILSQDEMDKYVIGYPALKRHVEITPIANEDEKMKWFNELVKYKESSRLYSTSSGKISISSKSGRRQYLIDLNWPYQAPPGDYTVTVYSVKDNKVVEKAEAKILVEQVNIVKALADMAKDKGAFYGMIAIIIALAAGFGVGIIFRKGRGSH
ncbi:MAG: TIGR02186 family protein [Nitrospirota bacterium]